MQTTLLLRGGMGYLERCQRRYGSVFGLRLSGFAAGKRHIVLADYESIGPVMRGDPEVFLTGAANLVVEPVAGPTALPLLDGSDHLQMRRLLLPGFHANAIREQQRAMRQTAIEHIGTWPRGEVIRLQPRLQALTLDVILQSLFGDRQEEPVRRLRASTRRVLSLGLRMGILPQLRRAVGPWSLAARFRRVLRDADDALFELIRVRKRDERETGGLLDQLIGAQDDRGEPLPELTIRDQLMALIVAGHETSATTLAWTLERLMRNPTMLERIRTDLDAGTTEYLEAAIKETLRLYPVVPYVMRKVTAPVEISGFAVDKGTVILCCIYLAHHDERAFPRPLEFAPERFLDSPDWPSPPSGAWIPFGGGVHHCLGGGFAMTEMTTVLGTILERLELRAPDPRPETVHRRGVWISPKHGTQAVAMARS